MERRTHHSVYELLQQERYTPDEVAELLGIGVHIIQHAAFSGELRAQIVGHDIISLQPGRCPGLARGGRRLDRARQPDARE